MATRYARLIGLGRHLLFLSVVLFLFGCGDTAVRGDLDREPSEEPARVLADYRAARPTTRRQFQLYLDRLLADDSPEAREVLRTIYGELVEGPGRDDSAARAYLGHVDFRAAVLGRPPAEGADPIPAAIVHRDSYPFLGAIQRLNTKRWLETDEDVELARRAVAEMDVHRARLIEDPLYRSIDQLLAARSTDSRLGSLNTVVRTAAPYVFVYASADSLSPYDLVGVEQGAAREEMASKIDRRQKRALRALDGNSALFPRLFKEWTRRFTVPLGRTVAAADRDDPAAGPSVGAEGEPLVVWILDDALMPGGRGRLPPGVAGYHDPRTGCVHLLAGRERDPDPVEAALSRAKRLHEGTHQLQHHYTVEPGNSPGASWFYEGLAEFLSGTRVGADGGLEFTDVNMLRLETMQSFAKMLQRRGGKYPVIPVEHLVSFGSYAEVQQWAASQSGWPQDLAQNAMAIFYQQSWAFTYFLNHFENGKYRDNWLRYFGAELQGEVGRRQERAAFARAFAIQGADGWSALQQAWEGYLRGTLMKLDPNAFR